MKQDTTMENTLKDLGHLYDKDIYPEYYSKLALLELCGWIELVMDEVVFELCEKRLQKDNLRIVELLIKNNYGFSYEKHFRKLLINVVGLINLEKIEVDLQPDLDRFISTLNKLYDRRCKAAHTYLKKDVTNTYDSPSVLLSDFKFLYNFIESYKVKLEQFLNKK